MAAKTQRTSAFTQLRSERKKLSKGCAESPDSKSQWRFRHWPLYARLRLLGRWVRHRRIEGASVKQSGANFRDRAVGNTPASDFDVSLPGGNLHARAAEKFPDRHKSDRVGPLEADQMKQLGIDVTRTLQGAGRDTRFMIYPRQIELYRRGPGYPLVTS